ncbi:FAD-dependent monooxygenase [Psychrobacter sp. H8-1]|uniref:FAD-dependent monooxygenase n=1 Tax=Psychrobacter sp. H8-1 TaxID=2774129 RepID=UPI001918213B|nr:FAD-dependent monooxygenase [Psychrobacter sp. H8-1]
MHFPTQLPRQSLYFDYQVYPYYHSQQDTQSDDQTVTLVGGGLMGMTTAIMLAKYGVKVILITDEQQLAEGSRALVYTKRSLEILNAAGAADAVMQKALPWTHGKSIYKGKTVFRMAHAVDENDQFPPLSNLQQNYLESYLLEQIEQHDDIEVRWGNKVVDLDDHKDHVTLSLQTPEGEYQHTSNWVVAADGGRSFIRSHLNLKMEGDSYEGRFVIADIRIKLDYPTERLAFFSPDWNPNNTILMHREPDDIWRFDYQLDPTVTPEEALKPENLKKAVTDQLKMIGKDHLDWKLDWSTVYSARALTLPDFVHNRIIFVGDAAHLLPIFGVRGANTGFQDALDVSWKLAGVINGWGNQDLLHSYSADRVQAAKEICAEAGKSTRFMSPPSHGYQVLRDAVLSLSLEHDFVRPLYHWRTSRPHAYHSSPLNSQNDDNASMNALTANGELFPNLKTSNGTYLYDDLTGGFSVLVFTNDAISSDLKQEINTLKNLGIPIKIIVLSATQRQVQGADVTYQIDEQVQTERYFAQEGSVYFVRPDHHIAGRWLNYDDHVARAAHAITEALTPFLQPKQAVKVNTQGG